METYQIHLDSIFYPRICINSNTNKYNWDKAYQTFRRLKQNRKSKK